MHPIRVRRVASAVSRRSPRRAFHVAAITSESGSGRMPAIRVRRNRVIAERVAERRRDAQKRDANLITSPGRMGRV
jgi:hypothetical protein